MFTIEFDHFECLLVVLQSKKINFKGSQLSRFLLRSGYAILVKILKWLKFLNSVPFIKRTTLNQSILGREQTQPWNWAGERKEERKEYSEALRHLFVIVWPIKINGHDEGLKSDWSNLFWSNDRSTISERTPKKGLEIAYLWAIDRFCVWSMRHMITLGCKLFNVVAVELASSTSKDESESRLDYLIREALERFSPVKTQGMTGLSSRGSSKSVTSM